MRFKSSEIIYTALKTPRLECKWRKSKSNVDHVAYVNQSNTVNNLIQTAKRFITMMNLKPVIARTCIPY